MEKQFSIFYTSDVHGYFSTYDAASGTRNSSGLACCVSNFEKDGNSLIIDGGDLLQGSPLMASVGDHRGRFAAKLMNIAGYDFVTLGNHDFNYGSAAIDEYLGELDAICLCANVSGISRVKKTHIITLDNGLKIGLTGLITEAVPQWERPENLEGIRFTDVLEEAASALDDLKHAGVDATVCIYHGGFEKDLETGRVLSAGVEHRAYEICEKLDFDILLTGHSHIPIEGKCICGTFVCQPPDRASKFITMDVKVTEDDISAVSALTSPSLKPDERIMRLLENAEKKCIAMLDEPVGYLDVPLPFCGHIEAAMQGSLIANLINQILLEVSGADISATGLGNAPKGFKQCVTVRDVVSTYVFPNTLKVIEVDRDIIKQALERCAEYYDYDSFGNPCVSAFFLHPEVQHFNFDFFSGIEYTTDIRRPIGNRVTSIRYEGNELSASKRLKLSLNNYRASGAGGYPFYSTCPLVYDGQDDISELIISYFKKHVNVTVDKTTYNQVIT